MIKLVLLDWDGVVTHNSTEGYIACYHQALKEVGVELPLEEEYEKIMKNWGKHYEIELEGLLEGLLDEDPTRLQRAIKAYKRHFFGESFFKYVSIIPGANTALNALSNYKVSVITGNSPQVVEKTINQFNLPKIFRHVLSSLDYKDQSKQKPSPFMIHEVLRLEACTKDQAIYVGDSSGDIHMARAASVLPIAVLSGNLTRKQAEELNVENILESINDLPELLTRLNAA